MEKVLILWAAVLGGHIYLKGQCWPKWAELLFSLTIFVQTSIAVFFTILTKQSRKVELFVSWQFNILFKHFSGCWGGSSSFDVFIFTKMLNIYMDHVNKKVKWLSSSVSLFINYNALSKLYLHSGAACVQWNIFYNSLFPSIGQTLNWNWSFTLW